MPPSETANRLICPIRDLKAATRIQLLCPVGELEFIRSSRVQKLGKVVAMWIILCTVEAMVDLLLPSKH